MGAPQQAYERIEQAKHVLQQAGSRVVILTGAGISAASGIPTFRGPDGYWTVGSENYHPESLATFAAFQRIPETVWAWYLHRLAICLQASPNTAHESVGHYLHANRNAVLITQNVDGLHQRSGSPMDRTYTIHGHIEQMRCARGCNEQLYPIPVDIGEAPEPNRLSEAQRQALTCPCCGASTRPHVLWFDESYNEVHFRFQSSIAAAGKASALVVIGTQGHTNLPNQVGLIAAQNGALLIDINPNNNPFAALARHTGGIVLEGPADVVAPQLFGASNP